MIMKTAQEEIEENIVYPETVSYGRYHMYVDEGCAKCSRLPPPTRDGTGSYTTVWKLCLNNGWLLDKSYMDLRDMGLSRGNIKQYLHLTWMYEPFFNRHGLAIKWGDGSVYHHEDKTYNDAWASAPVKRRTFHFCSSMCCLTFSKARRIHRELVENPNSETKRAYQKDFEVIEPRFSRFNKDMWEAPIDTTLRRVTIIKKG